MFKKRKIILIISGVALLLTFTLFGLKYILGNSIRKQLPEYPDFVSVSKTVKEQILAADKKAHCNPSADNLGMLGMVYYSSAYYDNAAKCYQLAVRKNKKKWIWSYYLGYLNLEQGESNASLESFKYVFEKDPKNYLALFYTGDISQSIGLTSNAETIFKKIAALNDSDFDKRYATRKNDFPLQTYALFRLARIYLNSNRLDSAEITLKLIIENQIKFGSAYRLLGTLYTREGNLVLGNKCTIRAGDLLDYTPPADVLIENIALIARSDTYLLKQIEDAIRRENFEWELQVIEHALKYNPDNKFLISTAIFAYLNLGLKENALPYLDQHIKYFGDDSKELLNVADLLYDKGLEAKAMEYFNLVKKLMPENSDLALWLLIRGKKEESVLLLNEQLKNDPKNVKLMISAVHMLMNMGEKDLAMAYLTNLNQIAPLNPEVKMLKGMMAEKNSSLKEALSDYEEAYKLDPKNLMNIQNLIALYIQEKMWDQAINYFRKALDNNPNEPFLLEGMGRLLLACPDPKLKNVNEAREYSERALININSKYETLLSAGRNLATAYAILGDKKKAIEYINSTTELAGKGNDSQEYTTYFNTLRKMYGISK